MNHRKQGLVFRYKSLFTLMEMLTISICYGQVRPELDLDAIRQTQPSFLVRAEVNRLSRQYQAGDQLSLSVVSEIDAYVYVLYQQADGQVFQVFPNSKQPQNRLRAKEAVQIPSLDDLFRWKIGPPFGEEKIKVIATDQPLRALADPKLKSKEFNPISKTVFKGVDLELQPTDPVVLDQATNTTPIRPEEPRPETPPASKWAEADVQIYTSPASPSLTNTKSRRVGVFFGVSEHQFASFQEAGGGRNPNLTTPHADAKVFNELMKDVGRLQETKTFTNSEATRKNLEETICQWLPGITRPGDTVVIYFSGHGGQLPDDNGDEPDSNDEFLVPYDYLGATAVNGMLNMAEANRLPAEYQPILQAVSQVVAQQGVERATDLLIRETGVTDDLFSHWLQKLDGRDVIVVLDICHSGGFATQEKGVEGAKSGDQFDFMDRELSRLKDIGQAGTALLTASSTSELSLVRQENDLSVMTYYLAEGLVTSRDSLGLEQAHELCQRGMQQYFRDHPNAPPHRPQLYNQFNRPVFLKP